MKSMYKEKLDEFAKQSMFAIISSLKETNPNKVARMSYSIAEKMLQTSDKFYKKAITVNVITKTGEKVLLNGSEYKVYKKNNRQLIQSVFAYCPDGKSIDIDRVKYN